MTTTFEPTHTYCQFDTITAQRATEPPVEGEIVERVELMRMMKDMYKSQSSSCLKWYLNEARQLAERGTGLSSLMNAKKLEEIDEIANEGDESSKEEMIEALVAFDTVFPQVPVCEKLGVPWWVTVQEMRVSLRTHGHFSTGCDRELLSYLLANQTQGVMRTAAMFELVKQTGVGPMRDEKGPWPHKSFFGSVKIGEEERVWGVKPESAAEQQMRMMFGGKFAGFGKGGKGGVGPDLGKGSAGKGQGKGGDKGGAGVKNTWADDEDHPLVQTITKVAEALRDEGLDDEAVVDLLADGMKGVVSESEAKRTLKGYEDMVAMLQNSAKGKRKASSGSDTSKKVLRPARSADPRRQASSAR